MVYFIKLLVASSNTPQTFRVVFLLRPLNADVSQAVIAYQNGNALHISSPKHFKYSCIVAIFRADQRRIQSKVH